MIQENVLRLKERIAGVCRRLGRNPQEIKIVAVTKGVTPKMIEQAISCGITDIGENRLQDAILKYNAIRNTQYAIRIKWHMVGHLQTNKVKKCVEIFDLIQSVDSLRVAQEVDSQAAKINKIQDILVQVNTSGEASKFGIKYEEAVEFIKEISKLKNLKLFGLMTIAPLVDNPRNARPYFRKLRELKEELNDIRNTTEGSPERPRGVLSKVEGRNRGANYDLRVLSMGMTDDFEVAIEEGSNMIRIGRAIFGNI